MITIPTHALMGIILLLLLAVIALLVWQNHHFLRSADQRLSKANEMVLTLAHSADTLAASVQHLKDMMVHLEQVYTSRTDSVIKSHDDLKDAYNKLLHRYTNIEDKYYAYLEGDHNTVSEIARQPTYTNLNNMPSKNE